MINRIQTMREASKEGNKVKADDYKNKMSVQLKEAMKGAYNKAEKQPRKGPWVTNLEYLRAISLGVASQNLQGVREKPVGWKQVHIPYPPQALACAFRKDVPLVSTMKGHTTSESSRNHRPSKTPGAPAQSYLLHPIQVQLCTINVVLSALTNRFY